MSDFSVTTLTQELGPDSNAWRNTLNQAMPLLKTGLADYMSAKGYDTEAMRELGPSGALGFVIDAYMLGNVDVSGNDPSTLRTSVVSDMAEIAINRANGVVSSYRGTPQENGLHTSFDLAAGVRTPKYQRDYRRNGASRVIVSSTNYGRPNQIPEATRAVPCAIIGSGASGILATRYLRGAGFNNITLFDKRGRYNGIWEQDNVRMGSKNNPFDIVFDGVKARSAQGIDHHGSGLDIQQYLRTLSGIDDGAELPHKALVTDIAGGDLDHHVVFKRDGEFASNAYPIVIYAPGVGRPLSPALDSSYMQTDETDSNLGMRWQQQLDSDKLHELAGKKVVLIGLGNSTAEMLLQFQEHERKTGEIIDYQILTHFSQQNLQSPNTYINGMRVFRDISRPELVGLAGDLDHIEAAFIKARSEARITGDVVSWGLGRNTIELKTTRGISMQIPFDKQYTLIGYGQVPEVNAHMSLTTIDAYKGSIAHDWDGEVQRSSEDAQGRERVYPGYFALGPILQDQYNPNAVTIPGIQYQLQQMLPTLIFRAAEYAHLVKSGQRSS